MGLPVTPEDIEKEFQKKPIKPETEEQKEEREKIEDRVRRGKPKPYEEADVEPEQKPGWSEWEYEARHYTDEGEFIRQSRRYTDADGKTHYQTRYIKRVDEHGNIVGEPTVPHNVAEYKIHLAKVAVSPFVSAEDKLAARYELQRLERYRERGYDFRTTYDVDTRERQFTIAKAFDRGELEEEQRLREEEEYQEFKSQYVTSLAENAWLAAPKILEGAYTKHDPSFLTSFGEFLFKEGTIPEKLYSAYDVHVRSQYEIHKAREKEGEWGYIKKIVEPGTPLFTAVSVAGISIGISTAIGGIAAVSQTVAKGVGIATSGYFISRGGLEAQSIAKVGKPMRWGGFLGLVPQGLQQGRPMTGAERFSSLAMMGASVPLAITGYKVGFGLGYKAVSKVYTPKYVYDIKPYMTRKTVFRDKNIEIFKGVYDYTQIKTRTIFGREIPIGKTIISAKLPIRGVTAQRDIPIIDVGKSAVWKAGVTAYEVLPGKIMRTFLGRTKTIDFTQLLRGVTLPERPLRTYVGKQTDVTVQPYEYITPFGKIIIKQPITALTLTSKQLGKELFKPSVESKFYPGISKNIIEGNKIVTKSVVQAFELPVSKQIMEKPHLVDIKVKRFTPGEIIEKYPTKSTEVYGFTHKGVPEIWVGRFDDKIPVIDMFGRTFRKKTESIIGHETTHRLFEIPKGETAIFEHAKEEFIVQVISQRKISYWWDKPETLSEYKRMREYFGLSHKELSARQKAVYPVVSKAAKNYMKTGELGLKEQRGTEIYQLTAFRGISITKSPTEIAVGKIFGISALLKGIKGIDGTLEPTQQATSYFRGKPFGETIGKTPSGQQIVTVQQAQFDVIPPTLDLSKYFTGTPYVGYVSGRLFESRMESRTEQQYITGKKTRDLEKIINIQIQPSIQDNRQILNILTGVDVTQKQMSASLQLQNQLQKQETRTTQVVIPTVPIIITPKPPILAVEEVMNKVMPGWNPNQAYNVFVKPRTYVKGKRIRKDEYNIKVNKKPLSYKDALSLGGHNIDHNEKASFVVVPVDGKPRKLSKRIPSFFSHAHEFYTNKKGQIVERASSRIDSPGEIEAITMRGVASRKKSSRGNRDLDKVNKMVDSTVKRMIKKAGGF